jgi:plasmid stabilization system protein ParE
VTVDWSPRALADLSRFAQFLATDHPTLATAIAQEIASKATILQQQPQLGRAIVGRERFRKIVLRAGGAPYVLEYRALGERIIIVRLFHAREGRAP